MAGGALQQPKGWSCRTSAHGFGDTAIWLACGGLPTSCRRPGHFSLLAQRKVTKRNGTPIAALAGEAGQCVRVGRAFRRGSCPGEKESASMPIPLRACRPPLTAAQGGPEVKSSEPPARAASLYIASMNKGPYERAGP